MRRLYLRIYFAVLASLAAFALAAAVLWRTVAEPRGDHELLPTIARNVLPPAGESAAEQQAALERLARELPVDLALFAPDGARLAAVGGAMRLPERAGWQRGSGEPLWATQLTDGRWVVARTPGHRRGPAFGVFTLALILVAVGVGAYPVVRRLTQRLERLQRGVEALGAGELTARVKVEGRDEVARLAESFNRAAARIEELVAAHRMLLANASHELRTPLSRIRLGIELMNGKPDSKYAADLKRDIAELDGLIDEILLASRRGIGALQASEEVDLLALAAEECARLNASSRVS
jgi:signal transduction histidine kinase